MESFSKPAEYVLDRSILERFPLFLECFLFLKSFNFLERVLNRFSFWKIFHWVEKETFNADHKFLILSFTQY